MMPSCIMKQRRSFDGCVVVMEYAAQYEAFFVVMEYAAQCKPLSWNMQHNVQCTNICHGICSTFVQPFFVTSLSHVSCHDAFLSANKEGLMEAGVLQKKNSFRNFRLLQVALQLNVKLPAFKCLISR